MIRDFHTSRCLSAVTSVLFALVLAACGGGGEGGAGTGPNGATPPTASSEKAGDLVAGSGPGLFGFDFDFGFGNAPAAKSTLLISEVAFNAGFVDDSAWFEVYNPGTATVNLSAFKLRSTSANVSSSSRGSNTFSLPSVNIPAKGYVVIAGKTIAELPDGPKMRYVANGADVPGWADSGFIELIRLADNSTDDFVRFGTDTTAPTTAGAWGRTSVFPLSIGASSYGKSVVRLASRGVPDTNASFDWSRVNFATPGGPNDVDPGVRDSDRDGVPDSAKVAGGTYAGMDLYAMGARPGARDIFVELHHMANNPAATVTDAALTPSKEVLQKVVDAFAAKGIRFHIDIGTLYSPTFNPAAFNLGGGAVVPFAKCTTLPLVDFRGVVEPGCSNFYEYKNRGFDVRRRMVFHYGLFANSQNVDGSAGSSGFAEIAGSDFMVTLGASGLSNRSVVATNVSNNVLASTFMHEFGHNLGLRHGGFEDTNYKPNYASIMNYTYQIPGLPDSFTTVSASDRYKYYVAGLNRDPNLSICPLSNSPCSTSYKIDYSDGSGFPLFERFLIEQNLLGRGFQTIADYADWNLSGLLDPLPYALDLNRDGVQELLRDHDDWSALVLPFTGNFAGFNSGDTAAVNQNGAGRRFNPMRDMGRQMVQEAPLNPMMMRMIQSASSN